MQYRVTIGTAPSVPAIWTDFYRAAGTWLDLRRSRAALLKLTDTQLLDVGLTRAMAREEAARSFLTDE